MTAKNISHLEKMNAQVRQLREEIARTRERAISDKQLTRRVWEVWGYMREHVHTLDSERVCNAIRALIDDAVADVQLRCEELAANGSEAGPKGKTKAKGEALLKRLAEAAEKE